MKGLKPNLLNYSKWPIVMLFLTMATGIAVMARPIDIQLDRLRINPEYKITRMSDGSVIVTSKNPAKKEFHQEFNDFYADLLMAAYRKQSISFITESLKKKYYMSDDECRREIKHAINVLSEWNIITSEQKPARAGR